MVVTFETSGCAYGSEEVVGSVPTIEVACCSERLVYFGLSLHLGDDRIAAIFGVERNGVVAVGFNNNVASTAIIEYKRAIGYVLFGCVGPFA